MLPCHAIRDPGPAARPPAVPTPDGCRHNGAVLVISRFRYDAHATERAQGELTTCLEGLGRCRGFLEGAVGRALDEPSLWVLQTRWDAVGSYRRALSTYDVKLAVVPLLSQAIDEPSAYEILVGEGATEPNQARSRRL